MKLHFGKIAWDENRLHEIFNWEMVDYRMSSYFLPLLNAKYLRAQFCTIVEYEFACRIVYASSLICVNRSMYMQTPESFWNILLTNLLYLFSKVNPQKFNVLIKKSRFPAILFLWEFIHILDACTHKYLGKWCSGLLRDLLCSSGSKASATLKFLR